MNFSQLDPISQQPRSQQIQEQIIQRITQLQYQFDGLNVKSQSTTQLFYQDLIQQVKLLKEQLVQKLDNTPIVRQRRRQILNQLINFYSRRVKQIIISLIKKRRQQLLLQHFSQDFQLKIQNIDFNLLISLQGIAQTQQLNNFNLIRQFMRAPLITKALIVHTLNQTDLFAQKLQNITISRHFLLYLFHIRTQHFLYNKQSMFQDYDLNFGINFFRQIYRATNQNINLFKREQNLWIAFQQYVNIYQKKNSKKLQISVGKRLLERYRIRQNYLLKQNIKWIQKQGKLTNNQQKQMIQLLSFFSNIQNVNRRDRRKMQRISSLLRSFIIKYDIKLTKRFDFNRSEFNSNIKKLKKSIIKYVSSKNQQLLRQNLFQFAQQQTIIQNQSIKNFIKIPVIVMLCKIDQINKISYQINKKLPEQQFYVQRYFYRVPQYTNWTLKACLVFNQKKLYINRNFQVKTPKGKRGRKYNFTFYSQSQSKSIQYYINLVFKILRQQLQQKLTWYNQYWLDVREFNNIDFGFQFFYLQNNQIKQSLNPPKIQIRNNPPLKYTYLIYNTSSLRTFFWQHPSQIWSHPSNRNWMVYSKTMDYMSYSQKYQQDLQDYSCFQKVFHFIYCHKQQQIQPDKFFKQKIFQNPYKFIQERQDLYMLCQHFKIGLHHQQQQFQQQDLFYPQDKYYVSCSTIHCKIKKCEQRQKKKTQIRKKTSSLSAIISGRSNIQRNKRIYKAQSQISFQTFQQQRINNRFATVDIQTYSQKEKIMEINLICLISWIPTQVYKRQLSWRQQSIRVLQSNNRQTKVSFRIEQDSIQNLWFGKKCNSIKQCVGWIMVNLSQLHYDVYGNSLIWWTFNGLLFDYAYLLCQIIKFIPKLKSYGQVNKSKGFRNRIMILQDARNFYANGSLAQLTKQNNIIYKKKNFKIQYIKGIFQYIKKRKQIIQYCQYDCLSLQQLIIRFFHNIWKMLHQIGLQKLESLQQQGAKDFFFQVNINKVLQRPTASNFALYMFQLFFLKNNYSPPDTPQQIAQQKRDFAGGMVQIIRHYIPKGQKVRQCDACSMYPSNMRNLPLWGYKCEDFQRCQTHQQFLKVFKHKIFHKNKILQQRGQYQLQQISRQFQKENIKCHQSDRIYDQTMTSRYLIRQLQYNNPKSYLPFNSRRNKEKGAYFNRGMTNTHWISGYALYQLLRSQTILQIVKVRLRGSYKYGKFQNPFWQFSQYCYKKRLIWKTKSKGMSEVFKLMLNSLYGKLLQKRYPKIQIISNDIDKDNNQYQDFQISPDLLNYNIRVTQLQQIPFSGDLITVGATITQRARVKISFIIRIVGIENCYYCDTDSLYINQQGLRLLRLRYNTIFGSNLSQWKIQNEQNPFVKGHLISRKCLLMMSQKFMIYTQGKVQKYVTRQQVGNQLQHRKQYQFQYDRGFISQNINYQQWLRDRICKIRMKGINFKINYQQCNFIIDYQKQFYQDLISTNPFYSENSCPDNQKLDFNFQVFQWKRFFDHQVNGVKIQRIIKNMSYNWKRIPLAGGFTKVFNKNQFIGFLNF